MQLDKVHGCEVYLAWQATNTKLRLSSTPLDPECDASALLTPVLAWAQCCMGAEKCQPVHGGTCW